MEKQEDLKKSQDKDFQVELRTGKSPTLERYIYNKNLNPNYQIFSSRC